MSLPEVLDGTLFGDDQPCFGCGPSHPFGFHLKLERDGDGVVAKFTPKEHYQGPIGIMHGGLVTTLADEVAAWAILAKLGKFGFTTSFEGRFKKPVRIGIETVSRARLVKEAARMIRVEVIIEQANEVCFEGGLSFVLLDQGGAERLLQRPLPAAWRQFTR